MKTKKSIKREQREIKETELESVKEMVRKKEMQTRILKKIINNNKIQNSKSL